MEAWHSGTLNSLAYPQVCEDCPNVKYERETEFLRVHVEPGMHEGHEILQFEEGEPMVDGEPGDLKVLALSYKFHHLR
eukprot:scaffold596139_cov34-Prasinocladus_malaysianus.AAC.1